MSHSSEKQSLKVIIVGAGLGGLMLGLLLERAGIDYHIFERSPAVTQMGAVLVLNANILPVFKQLGLFEELRAFSLPIHEINLYNDRMDEVGAFDQSKYFERTGYEALAFSRPELYDLMLRQLSSHKITFGKRVLSVKHTEDKILVRCSDNLQYEADVVVGADGANSAVRQSLYRDLSDQGILPKVDREDMKSYSVNLFGVTDPLDTEMYPDLKGESAKFVTVSGGGLTWITVGLPGNRFSWGTGHDVTAAQVAHEKLTGSIWTSDQTAAMIKEVSGLPLPMGGTLGDLIAQTPKDRITRSMLEEKMFETWYSGRVVLLGDACHKMIPGAGQGAVNALQDAVILANCLNNLSTVTSRTITEAFQDYKCQRYDQARRQTVNSRKLQSFVFAQTKMQEFVRFMMMTVTSKKSRAESFIRTAVYQPQISFLPMVQGNPDYRVLPQHVFKPYGTSKNTRPSGTPTAI